MKRSDGKTRHHSFTVIDCTPQPTSPPVMLHRVLPDGPNFSGQPDPDNLRSGHERLTLSSLKDARHSLSLCLRHSRHRSCSFTAKELVELQLYLSALTIQVDLLSKMPLHRSGEKKKD